MFENIISQYGFACDFFAIILCMICYSVMRSSYTIKQSNLILFKGALFIISCSAFQSILFHSMLHTPFTTDNQFFWFFTFQNSVLIGLCVLLCIMGEYCSNVLMFTDKQKKLMRIAMWLPTAGYMIYKFITPLIGMDIFINKQSHLVEGYGLRENAFLIMYIYLCAIIMIMLLVHKKRLMANVWKCLVYNTSLSFITMVIQYILNIDTFTVITFTIPVISVLFLFHYNAYDVRTGSLDARAFKNYIKELDGKSFAIMSLYLKEFIIDGDDNLSRQFVNYIQNMFGNRPYRLFRTFNDRMVLVYEDKDMDEGTLRLMRMRIKDKLDWIYHKYGIPYQLVYITSKEGFKPKDYFGLSDFLLDNIPLNTYYICTEKDIETYRLHQSIEDVLEDIRNKGDLNDERVIVQYQPIINGENKYTKAEALMRLKVGDAIYSPDLFLPIAEHKNYAHSLSKIVLNKVCRRIKELQEEGYRFENISINLSTSDFMLSDGYEDFIQIVEEENEMDFKKLAFEILETTDKVMYEPLIGVMSALKKLTGVQFYLDDFGSGYSNLQRVLALPVDTIKFDRSILKEMKKNHKTCATVQMNIKSLQEAGHKILFEGVETEMDIETCRELGVEYLQGYVYSKPVEFEELKTFFEK